MKNKGFTLIELLAVIVILAIIALIATPIVMDSIATAKKGAAKDAAYGFAKAAEYSIALKMETTSAPATISTGDIANVSVKGTKPDTAALTLTNGAITGGTLVFGSYTATFGATGAVTVTP